MIELVVLGLGSNLGRRFDNIRNAVKSISQSGNFNLLGVSSIYETEPWGYENQRNFLNCTVVGFYRASHDSLLREVNLIEKKLGRVRIKKWHPRIIDIDILFFGKKIIKSRDLMIPHQQIHVRNFVLKPLCDLMPGFVHPVLKKTVRYLYGHSKDTCHVWLYKTRLL